MIAPRELPAEFYAWNRRHRAPFGRRNRLSRYLGDRYRGPFAFQANNGTRVYEYPWAYSAINAHRVSRGRPLTIVELGGSLAGLQWVLAREGHRVINVDPGLEARGVGWEVNADRHRALSRTFGAPVELIPKTLAAAGLADGVADVLLAVSTIEHFAPADLAEFAAHAARIIRPDGIVILTIDLFLDLSPFSDVEHHQYGTNVDIRRLLADAKLELVQGNPKELHGYPEFTPERVLAGLAGYLVGQPYPALAQCLIARRML
ncbi:MAG TPA: methyltransferase domain-containing protein [Gemmatimonadaceae bacterium]|jgi:SAM-dependent methyltransferase|nr:methyltransferase domain-containing protein [Gemmatimonadaceae bacterium]